MEKLNKNSSKKKFMEIFKTSPRLVFLNNHKVYKFFKSNFECKDEVEKIKNSPISEIYDEVSQYKMKFVKILEICDNFYTMEQVKGKSLNISNSIEDYRLAGSWLRCFHDLTYNSKDKKVFLFGDFITSHLHIDHECREINAIDPGASFGMIGEIEIDISRFLVSLLQTKNFKIIKLNRVMVGFLNGYNIDKISYSNLDKFIKIRIFRNYEKIIKLNTGFKRNFIAYFFLILSKIKYHLVKKNLKRIII